MKDILNTVGRVIKGLIDAGLAFESSDDFENDFSPQDYEVEVDGKDHYVFVGDDDGRDHWVILTVTPKDGVDVWDTVSKVLGDPIRTYGQRGTDYFVTNHEIGKVLVVNAGDRIEFFRDYKKV